MARPRESAVPTRGLATPRVGSQPDVVSCVVSQEIRVTAPRQARRTRVTGAMDGRIVPASSWMRKCASIFCLYIKVCSASVFTILAGRRLLPPGWCCPWDHSPVGFVLWFMWLISRPLSLMFVMSACMFICSCWQDLRQDLPGMIS